MGEEKWQFIDGCQRDWDTLPPPGPPLIVGLDGGFIHAKDQKSRGEGWFEVIAGKSMPEEGVPKCFAYVQSYDTKPKRRLFELMKSQGLQANQQVTFLSDGADDVRELPLYLSPESEHWLDWFHVAMRLRVMGQMAKGLVNEQNMMSAQEPLTEAGEELDTVDIGKQLERVKWFLWHGNVGRALDTIDDVEGELDLLPQVGESRKKLLKAVGEFRGYIEANQNSLRMRSDYAAVFLSSVRSRSGHPGYWRATITARRRLAPVQSCFSKLLLRQYTPRVPPLLLSPPIAHGTLPVR